MAASTRTDVHRPSAPEFDPADYQFRGVFDLHPEYGDRRTRLTLVNKLIDAGYSFGRAPHGSGQCSHCGAYIRYAAMMTHDKTMAIITIGEQCLDNRFSVDKAEFDQLRKAAAAARAEQRLLTAFNELCQETPELVWATYADNIGIAADESGVYWEDRNRKGFAVSTLRDIARKVRQYGAFASEKQAQLVVRLVGELEAAEAATAEREAKAAAERDARPNAAIGEIGDRREFQGTVRWFDHFTEFYGYSEKTSTVMIIDTPEGTVKWKASKYVELAKGVTIRIKATVKDHTVYDRDQSITTVVTRGQILPPLP
jgi:hypothetical protein